MYILIKIHIFCMFGFSGRVCNFSGSGRVGFVIFFSGSGRVRVSKKPSGRVGFSGFRVPDPSLADTTFLLLNIFKKCQKNWKKTLFWYKIFIIRWDYLLTGNACYIF